MSLGLIEGLVARVESLERQLRELRELRAAPAQPVLLGAAGVAAKLDTTRRALQESFRRAKLRGEAHPLEQLSFTMDGVRRWRVADVEAYIAAKVAR